MKTQLLIKFPAVFLILILNGGCLKMNVEDTCSCISRAGKTCVVYNSTNCNDPWGYGTSREQTGRMIRNYFSEKDIQFYSIGFDENGTGEDCYSCSCFSGLQICAQVGDDDVMEVVKQGFNMY